MYAQKDGIIHVDVKHLVYVMFMLLLSRGRSSGGESGLVKKRSHCEAFMISLFCSPKANAL